MQKEKALLHKAHEPYKVLNSKNRNKKTSSKFWNKK